MPPLALGHDLDAFAVDAIESKLEALRRCTTGPAGQSPEAAKLLAEAALEVAAAALAAVAVHVRQEVRHRHVEERARAQGESTWGLIWHHGLRNVALPAITLQFASLDELFGGSVLAEQVFSYPGLGQATVQAGLRSDVPLLLGIVLFSTSFIYIGNTLADLIYRLVDPRIRLGE